MAWILLFVAGIFEVIWAFALKQSDGLTRLAPSVVATFAMIASVVLLALSMKSLPLGTAYVVWTGIGSLGAFLTGVAILGKSVDPLRATAAGLIGIGLVLMRLSSSP